MRTIIELLTVGVIYLAFNYFFGDFSKPDKTIIALLLVMMAMIYQAWSLLDKEIRALRNDSKGLKEED